MTTRITLRPRDGSPVRAVTDPTPTGATASGACPGCGASPYRIAGGGLRPSADDRAWEADGACLACRAPAGVIRAEASTIFGVREDQAVLCGRPRVY